MIIREIKYHPLRVLEHFDFFNDYADTMKWLKSLPVSPHFTHDRLQEIIELLETKHNEYLEEQSKIRYSKKQK